MAIRAYVLLQCEVGKARAVADALDDLDLKGARVLTVDTVTGPYDVISVLETEDLEGLGDVVIMALQRLSGVERSLTCLAIQV